MIVPTPRRLKNGKYYIYLRLGGEGISITEATERACIHAAELAKAEYLNGKRRKQEPAPENDQTVGQLVEAYIGARSRVLSPSTIRGYRIIQRNRFQALQARPARELTPEICQRAVNAESALCGEKTLRNAWALIQKAVEDGTGARYQARLPQLVRRERPFLMPDQIDVFVDAVRGTTVEIPALLGLCSLRCSEILGLRWQDVDTRHACVHVRGSTVPDEYNRFVRKETAKNASSIRTVPIMPQLVEALEAAPRDGEMVVAYTESWLFRSINRICEANGLPLIGIHGLRHSFASLAYHLGMPEHIAMQIGGWKDETTIRKIYRHIADIDLENSVNEMQKYYSEIEKRKLNRKPDEKTGLQGHMQ